MGGGGVGGVIFSQHILIFTFMNDILKNNHICEKCDKQRIDGKNMEMQK